MKRLDHSMIFLFIAGTYTPFSLLAVDQPTGYWVLAGVWAGALAGVSLKLTWPTAPRWVGVPLYIGLGWVAVFILTDILHIAGVTSLVLLAVGGVLYTLGGVAYAVKKPNPWPGVFGYHEVFHAMTVVAAICHYIAVYFAMYNSPFV
jgi:hemolysin III